MTVHQIIRDIALKVATEEYATVRKLGASAGEAAVAGALVMLDIRKIATGQRHDEIAILLLDDPANRP
jgi:hypothetical protein